MRIALRVAFIGPGRKDTSLPLFPVHFHLPSCVPVIAVLSECDIQYRIPLPSGWSVNGATGSRRRFRTLGIVSIMQHCVAPGFPNRIYQLIQLNKDQCSLGRDFVTVSGWPEGGRCSEMERVAASGSTRRQLFPCANSAKALLPGARNRAASPVGATRTGNYIPIKRASRKWCFKCLLNDGFAAVRLHGCMCVMHKTFGSRRGSALGANGLEDRK